VGFGVIRCIHGAVVNDCGGVCVCVCVFERERESFVCVVWRGCYGVGISVRV